MSDYTAIIKSDRTVSMCFYIEQDKPFAVGEKMNALNPDAYMNGYNWEAFFNYYLAKYHSDILENMATDPEAGMYVAFYPFSDANLKRAERFAEIIKDLIENEHKLYQLIESEGDAIAWD